MSTASVKSCDPFERSAEFYDLIHAKKDYDREAAVYMAHFWPFQSGRLLEIGCGTGEFLQRFVAAGWKGEGCDFSEPMLEVARSKNLEVFKPAGLNFGSKYDVACSPFTVVSYAGLTNRMLLGFLHDVRKTLVVGGRFVFDVFNLAAVSANLRPGEERPLNVGQRIGRNGHWQLSLRTEKKFFAATSTVVLQQFHDLEGGTETVRQKWQERHIVRAFSPQELDLALTATGFRMLGAFPLERDGREVTKDDFYFLVSAEAV